MRALGIDPGSRVTGWGVVASEGGHFSHLASGVIALPPGEPLERRLAHVHAECRRLIAEWAPTAVVIERAFVARNVQAAFRLGEARGAVLAAVGSTGLALAEYAPAEVKLAAVGHGGADKETVGRGVAGRLGIRRPALADATDALALALCHLQQAPLARRIAAASAVGRRAVRVRGARA